MHAGPGEDAEAQPQLGNLHGGHGGRCEHLDQEDLLPPRCGSQQFGYHLYPAHRAILVPPSYPRAEGGGWRKQVRQSSLTWRPRP